MELVPVLGRIHVEKRVADSVVESPPQRDLARFTVGQLAHDGAMPSDFDVDHDIRFALHVDHFLSKIRLLPSIWSEVLALSVESFNKSIFDGWAHVGESPGHLPVVPN